jgi:hypothetical protein
MEGKQELHTHLLKPQVTADSQSSQWRSQSVSFEPTEASFTRAFGRNTAPLINILPQTVYEPPDPPSDGVQNSFEDLKTPTPAPPAGNEPRRSEWDDQKSATLAVLWAKDAMHFRESTNFMLFFCDF